MKKIFISLLPFLMVACRSTQPMAVLTPSQATVLALQYANDKADTMYHCRPFRDGKAASLKNGHWVWNDYCGAGRCDLQADVELAMNGQPQKINVSVFVNEETLRDELGYPPRYNRNQ